MSFDQTYTQVEIEIKLAADPTFISVFANVIGKIVPTNDADCEDIGCVAKNGTIW
jgi:hypothetical protein